MKFKARITTGVALAGLLGAAATVTGQAIFTFDISEDGFVNENDVSMSGTADFDSLPSFTLSVFNNSVDPSSITELYILKPMTSEGRRLDALTLDSVTPTPSGDWDGKKKSPNPLNELDTDTENILKLTGDLYFGAALDPPGSSQGISQGDSATFSFTLESLVGGESVDWSDYFEKQIPHVVVRWQSVGQNDELSSAGYGYFTPVPEPELIAPLAVAGLGGLLWGRRRIRAAKAKRAGK